MSNGEDLDVEAVFLNLKNGQHRKTSLSTLNKFRKYNCIAFAAGDERHWWQPSGCGQEFPGRYWPPEAPSEYSLDSYKRAFELLGYTVCDNPDMEDGFEKVAIYWGRGPHAAKQYPNGKWRSKLGDNQDIEHNTLDGLEGDYPAYGEVQFIMKRPVGKS